MAAAPIRSEADYDRAVAVLERLVLRREEEAGRWRARLPRNAELAIERYDHEHYPCLRRALLWNTLVLMSKTE